jgi:cyclophilin family peptidyl-prolyl cis-trans isomerase
MKTLRLLLGVILVAVTAMTFAQYKPASGETVVRLDIKDRGSIFIKLFTKEAPKTTQQIISLVDSGFYNNQRFHRVEKSPKPFLVQVGAPGSKEGNIDDKDLGTQGSGKQIDYEDSGYKNDSEGMVGLSTQPGNRNSGDSQFYILLGPAKFLDGNYTVFGKVVSGMEVLRKIEKGDRITSATILKG